MSWFVTDRDRRGLTYDLELYQAELNTYIKFATIDSQIGKDDAADKPDYHMQFGRNWMKISFFISDESYHLFMSVISTPLISFVVTELIFLLGLDFETSKNC